MYKEIAGISEKQLESVVELFNPCMDDYLYVFDLKRDYYRISSNALTRFALPSDSFYDATEKHKLFVYSDDIDILQNELKSIMSHEKSFHDLHYRWLDKEGNAIWINCRGRVIYDENGAPGLLVGCINEIGNKQKADNISGLLGESSLSEYVKQYGDTFPSGFFMRIGIDDFSSINGNLGMKYGDFILKRTAECISKNLRCDQKLFRIVADEFMIVDFSGNSIKDAHELYRQLRQSVSDFIEENKYQTVYTISAGILDTAIITGGYEGVMKLSEFALKEAKNEGKNSYYVFEQEKYDAFVRKRKITRALHHAVNNNFEGFEAYFQPIVDAKTYNLIGAEALMRFTLTSEDGVTPGERISPAEFIPLLEDTGLIIPTGKWMLNEAIDMCSKWQKYIPDFRVNINLSYIQISKSCVLDEILLSIKMHHLNSSSVGIELTESGYLDTNPHIRKLWDGLKKNGVKIILDDFGTGYSNLHCLGELNPTYIKIDRTFTIKALNNEYERELLTHIIEMSHSLGLSICIEGIETKKELMDLRNLEPDYIQGYLFGKPYSIEEFYERFIQPKNTEKQ